MQLGTREDWTLLPDTAGADEGSEGVESVKILPICDWNNFTNIAITPAVMYGKWDRGIARGGWVYLLWFQGRLGLKWGTVKTLDGNAA